MKRFFMISGLVLMMGLQYHLQAQKKAFRLRGYNNTTVCYASDVPVDRFIPPPEVYRKKLKSGEIDNPFNLTIKGGTSIVTPAAMEATNIWASLISSPVTINVELVFTDLPRGTLGSAYSGPAYIIYDNGFIEPTVYASSLAEKIIEENMNYDNPDMSISFNKNVAWYFGLDGNTPDNMYDFLTVLLHEMTHGIGFYGAFFVDNQDVGFNVYSTPGAFDLFFENVVNQQLVDTSIFPNPSEKLGEQLITAPIYFKGPVTKVQASEYPVMYIPSSWDNGSSLYHLDDVYDDKDNGKNALMTFSGAPSEANHDPGPLATNMMYDIGWAYTYIRHDSLRDRESLAEPFTIMAEITGDKGLLPNTQYLFYTFDGFQSTDSILMTPTGTPNEYEADIPVTELGTSVEYYLQTRDVYQRVFTKPSQLWRNETGYSFYVGQDTTPPVIGHIPVNFVLVGTESVDFEANIIDNLGVDSTMLVYSINDVEQDPIDLVNDTLDNYSVSFDLSGLNIGDEIKYRIRAVDAASLPNVGFHPDTLVHLFKVEDIPPVADAYENDFETPSNDFLTTGFGRDMPVGFSSYGLHSDHPYLAPNKDDTFWDFVAQLRIPIRLRPDDAFMYFEEIVYIEPGKDGTNYGDDEFWDFVIVEGSKDNGNTWHNFEDGWDCRFDTTWENNYNNGIRSGNDSEAVPNESEKRSRLLNMLANPYFESNDEVLIRFHLHSDPYARGWGWMIDNLKIQGSITSVKEYDIVPDAIRIYPNPSDGKINLSMQLKEDVRELRVEVLDMLGKRIMHETYHYPGLSFSRCLNLDELPNGVYMVRFSTGNQSVNRKFILAR